MQHTLYEPLWGVKILNYLNGLIATNEPIVGIIVGVLADIFVFTYPIVLLYWFIIGYYQKKNNGSSLYSIKILLNTAIIALFNSGIQAILFKDRPIFAQGENLNTILKELPTASFPSDHASVSMIIGLSAYFYGKKSNNKQMKYIGIFRIISSFIMGICRVVAGVHRPTDILAGRILACSVFLFIKNNKYIDRFSKKLLETRQYISIKLKLELLKK